MLGLHVDIGEYLELDAVLTLKNVENLLSMSFLGLGKVNLIVIVGILRLSEADLVVLKDGKELFPHVILEISVVSSSHALG